MQEDHYFGLTGMAIHGSLLQLRFQNISNFGENLVSQAFITSVILKVVTVVFKYTSGQHDDRDDY